MDKNETGNPSNTTHEINPKWITDSVKACLHQLILVEKINDYLSCTREARNFLNKV